MTQITVDARAAGQGKTTIGIYTRIHANIALGQKTLVVVPSIELQGDYQAAFPHLHIINHDTNGKQSVYKTVMDALANESLVCITQKAFLSLPFKTRAGLFGQWDLILDEVFLPFTSESITAKGKLNGLHFDELFELDDIGQAASTEDDVNYFSVRIRANEGCQNLFQVSPALRNLTSEAFDFECTRKTFDSILKGEAERVELMGVLAKEVLTSWRSVHIAAAAFEKTPFKNWLELMQLKFTVTNAFVPGANGSIRFHVGTEYKLNYINQPTPQPFNFTNYIRNKHPEVVDQFTNYVREHLPTNAGVIWAANTNQELNLADLDGIELHKVKHNPHGINHLRHTTAVILGTAIRLSPISARWLARKFNFGSVKGSVEKGGFVEKVVSYVFYQIAMRTSLRDAQANGGEVDIFVLDGLAGWALMDYFQVGRYGYQEIIIQKQNTKPLSDNPSAIYQRARRAALAAIAQGAQPVAKKDPKELARERARRHRAKKKAELNQ